MGKRGHRRQDHDGQHDGAGQDAHAGLRAEDGLAGGDDHVEADEAEHDGGNTHEQLDERLEDLLAEVRANLDRKDRRPDGDGQRDGGRQQRDRERRDDERQRPGLWQTGLGIYVGKAPIGPGEEADEVHAVLEEGGEALLRDHDDKREDQQCHERDARARDTKTDLLKVALGHLFCHDAPFERICEEGLTSR